MTGPILEAMRSNSQFPDLATAGPGTRGRFDAVHRSKRHKSGVAMRFPRVHRIRWDKPPDEANRLETVKRMLEV